MNPSGCPTRRVVMISDPNPVQLRGHGLVLKLECGHAQWVAGLQRPERGEPVAVDFVRRPCLEGPCYQFQKGMGDQC